MRIGELREIISYNRIVLFVIMCLLFVSFESIAQSDPIKLKIATFNVGHFNQGMRGGLEAKGLGNEEFEYNYAKLNLLNWKKWFSEQSVDLFSLNEWNYYFDHDSLFQATNEILSPLYNNIYWGDENDWIYNGLATNYQLSNIRIRYFYGEYYAILGDLSLNGKTVTVISVHLPWQEEWHVDALNSLQKDLDKFEYFICMGDMNATDEEQKSFMKKGFNMANGGLQGFFATGRKKQLLKGMQENEDRHLDNIITSKNIKIVNITAPLTTLNDYDHLPIIADVVITFN